MAAEARSGETRARSKVAVGAVAFWLVLSAAAGLLRRLEREPPWPRQSVGRRRPPASNPAREITGFTAQPWPTTVSTPQAPAQPARPASAAVPAAVPTRGFAAWQVFIAIVIALGGGALLNAEHLEAEARQMPYGARRDFWVSVWSPLADVSRATGLAHPRRWLDDLLGRELAGSPTGDIAALVETAEPHPLSFPAPSQDPATRLGPLALVPPPERIEPPQVVITTPPPRLRTPTAEAPLRVWVGGDSMAGIYGQSLVRMAVATGLMSAEDDARASTGLTRPDYFDWPAHLARETARLQPDVVVVLFGANDPQGLRAPDGRVHAVASDGWVAEYRRRVATLMDQLEAPGRLVIWTGQPVMEGADLSEKMALMNDIYRQEAEKRWWVEYLDTWSLMADANGRYAAYLPGPDGRATLMRAGDGIHLSRAGGDRMAQAALELILREAGLAP